YFVFFFFSSRRRHTRSDRDWSSDVCSSDLLGEFFHTALITNLAGAGSSLIRHHLARGGMENYIEEFKHGLGAAHLPSQNFHANRSEERRVGKECRSR